MDFNRLISRTANSPQRSAAQGSSDSLVNSHDTTLRDAPRSRHIFPGGFGNPDQAKTHPVEFTLPQLEDILIKQHTPNDHVEHIYVKSAQYCKEYDKPQREFILITVETTEDPRFSNFLVLDRTNNSSERTGRDILPLISSSISSSKSKDRIRVSYDGVLKPLIGYCGFSKYAVLETLQFQKATFHLYEMVALARAASESHQGYSTLSNPCQWYTSLVWDCTRQLVPTATHTQNTERGIRGRLSNLFRQRIDFMELSTVSGSVGQELIALRQEFVGRQRLLDVPRNRHIFPPGFGISSRPISDPIEFTLPHLEDILIQQHTPDDHVEHIYVKSAQYCKERDKPQHEFILVTVETAEDPRLRNYLILDRTSSLPADKVAQHFVQAISPCSSSAQAKDRLRISYDGTLKPLLDHCSLSKYRVLETLEFKRMSFLLYELVALSRAASDRHRAYNTLSNQCYWYASLIWDCTRRLFPAATLTHTLHTEKNIRGKFGKVFHQRIDPKELSTISDGVGQELNLLKRRFVDAQKNRSSQESALAQEQERNAQLRREIEELRSRSSNRNSIIMR
ncbi:hypothetical protein FRC07_003020 [Ceratobasidium sp. 392]|nr:hypothetical protein FRC07_003020 [Ceratobasidium sp. 392]